MILETIIIAAWITARVRRERSPCHPPPLHYSRHPAGERGAIALPPCNRVLPITRLGVRTAARMGVRTAARMGVRTAARMGVRTAARMGVRTAARMDRTNELHTDCGFFLAQPDFQPERGLLVLKP
jgi:hypothetical protein